MKMYHELHVYHTTMTQNYITGERFDLTPYLMLITSNGLPTIPPQKPERERGERAGIGD